MIQQPIALKASACPLSRIFGPSTAEPMSLAARIAVFAYGLLAYISFVGAILYAIGFVANFLVPKSIDSGTPGRLVPSLLFNTAVLSVFVLQHTIMARPWFKRWWTRIIPACVERSTFVLTASAALGLAFWLWRPLPSVIWSVDTRAAAVALTGLSLFGWALVLVSSFMVSHWDLFGLRQVFLRLTNQEYRTIGFRIVGLYRLVRHPLMLGFIIAVWATPVMTVGHLFFAVMITGYIFLGTTLEERDLVAHFGDQYRSYRRRVPGIFPLPRPRRSRA
jgi:protein-S-isoprenylcysteine O-methyltransferase Ste14